MNFLGYIKVNRHGDKDEILGRKDKIILGVMLLCLFSLISALNYFGFFEDKYRDEVLDKEFTSVITFKYIDSTNHMSPKIKLSNGNEMINYFPKQNIELLIGDSLVKRKKSTDMLVFRDKKLLYSISLLDE